MKRKGFTLMELLIVVALVGIIAVVGIVLINPWTQIGKGHDAKRKRDLNQLQKTFEEYYNNTGCYPTAEMVCFDTPKNVCTISRTVTRKQCKICGNEARPTGFDTFEPYMPELPCDPEHPKKDYLYEVDRPGCAQNPSSCAEQACTTNYCPKWFRVYSDFSYDEDTDSKLINCYKGGCGPTAVPTPTSVFGYDYGVSSGQVGLEKSNSYNCIASNICNACQPPGDYDACVADSGCPDEEKIYATRALCCNSSPKPANCP